MSDIYNADSIEVLEGLDPVKKRPGMYTDTSCPNHLLQEIIDNSVDEALSGYANTIFVNLLPEGGVEIIDNGRGMPVDKHPESGLPGVELILSKLHSGGKFSKKNYGFSGGLHGVGISVVNALSRRLDIEVYRQGHCHAMSFEDGIKVSNLSITGPSPSEQTGTLVRFWPNNQYFDSPKIATQRLKNLLRAKAVLCPGLTIHLMDHNTDESMMWHYENGLYDYFDDQIKSFSNLLEEPFIGRHKMDSGEIEWAVNWLIDGDCLTESYVNLVPTIQGGTHVNGLRSGLTEAIRDFCDMKNLLPKNLKLAPEDVWDRCHSLLSVKILEPQFAGQTKDRLNNRECANWVGTIVKDSLSLKLNSNPEWGAKIAEFVIERAEARTRSARQVSRKKLVSGPALPGKLSDCSLQDLARTELFLVEGDSAGGSAKQARDRTFQAILPLRGKILNTWEVGSEDVLLSQEVRDISVALGVEPGASDLSGLRYGKICILADADSDGNHIATLLCALFLKHFKPLVSAGHVYVAMPPLYRIDAGKQVFYALDDAEKSHILKKISKEKNKSAINVQRFKGLGEMNPEQLRETTIRQETRRLIRLTLKAEADTFQTMDMLLGKKRASDRKSWLENSRFTLTV